MATSEHRCIDERTATDFVAGRLDAASADGVEAHMSRCADCRRVISALALSLPAADAPTPPDDGLEGSPARAPVQRFVRGATLGRYVVLDPVGAGAMGQVYVAHDGKLDRRVALKVLHPSVRVGESADHATRGIVREAKALARVAHPNVIAVHDVGSEAGIVFVAMELVRGATLTAWMTASPRPWAETLAVFVQAGAGLAAAHEAGLVHRDFKPSNVLVADDGRVRVLDFGLARALPSAQDEEPVDAPSQGADGDLVGPPTQTRADPVTRTGAVLGTPAYMAPEQLRGQPADPRADQFAFCVSLYEALYGARPFLATQASERLAEIDHGPPNAVAPSGVPAWLHEAIVRGLAPERESRWPTMNALLEHVETCARPSRRRLPATLSLAAAVLGVGGLVAWRADGSPPSSPPCSDARRHLEGRWDAAKKVEVRDALLATEVAWAQPTWELVEARLDAYADRWAAIHTETCRATHVRGEQSEAVGDLRLYCLQRRAAELGALTDRLSLADGEIVTQALQAASTLPSPASCNDIETLLAVAPRPNDPMARESLDRVTAKLARAEALRATGEWVEGLRVAREAAARATALAYRPLEAEARLAEGRLLTANSENGLDSFYRALWAAEAGRDDTSAVQAATELANTLTDHAEFDEAARWIEHAGALLERRGGDEGLEIELSRVRAELNHESGDYAQAIEDWNDIVKAVERREGETPQLAAYLGEQGTTLQTLGRLDEAEQAHTRSLAVFEQSLGPDHPSVAEALNKLAGTLTSQGAELRARPLHERALSIRERAFGPAHYSVAISLANVGSTYLGLGEVRQAVAVLQRAEAIMRAANRDRHVYALVLQALGNALRLDGRLNDAVKQFTRALDLSTETLGAAHPSTAICAISLSAALYEQGEYGAALVHAQRALALRSASLGADSPELAYDYSTVGRSQLGLGQTEAAIASFEHGLRLVNDAGRATRAELQFSMARALWGDDRARAEGFVDAARREAKVLGERADPLVLQLDAWVRDHP
ncbi:MAG: tetratricopeptide repeat protein [Myxococcota bacterium]